MNDFSFEIDYQIIKLEIDFWQAGNLTFNFRLPNNFPSDNIINFLQK